MKPHAAILALLLSAPLGAAPRGESALPAESSTAAGIHPSDRAAMVAVLDPALLAGPAPLAAPLVFAHGNLGIPRVITWANLAGTSGIAWGTTASIAAGNAYVSYNGTDMILNVPTGDGFSFLVNNVEIGGLPTAGGFETNVIQILSGTTLTINDAAGNAGPVFTDAGTTINTALDGSLAINSTLNLTVGTVSAEPATNSDIIAVGTVWGEGGLGTDATLSVTGASTLTGDATLNGGTDALVFGASAQEIRTVDGVLSVAGGLSLTGTTDIVQLLVTGNATQTTLPFVVENSAGTDQFTVSNAGAVVAAGSMIVGTTEMQPTYMLAGIYYGNNFRATGGGPVNIVDNDANPIASFHDGVAANPTDQFGQLSTAHISGGGGSTTGAVAGTGCGTSSAPTQSGNDIGGSLGATCGTAGTTTNAIITVTFADAYSTAPYCTVAPMNAATAAVMVSAQIFADTTTTTLRVACGGGTCPTGTLLFSYSCSQ